MSKYLVIDAAHLFFRCIHGSQGDAYSRAGLALHLIFRSIKKVWKMERADHVVFCLEGKSWRNEIYNKYKASRKLLALQKTQKEKEEDEIFMATLDELIAFLREKTNVTVLQAHRVEGDDFWARWIQVHPDDEHVLITGDSDAIQVLDKNVKIYDGVRELMLTTDGVFDKFGNPMQFTVKESDGKIKVGKELNLMEGEMTPMPEWWKYALFIKCMRGDAGDGIFSAYPKVRATKLRAAWEDRAEMGYNWNNLMLQTWEKEGTQVRVMDQYAFNQKLIDLTQQPQDIKDLIDATIVEQVQKPKATGVGIHFMRFCERNGLVNVGKEAPDHAIYLNAPYIK